MNHCRDCKHYDTPLAEHPCSSCFVRFGERSNFEPQVGPREEPRRIKAKTYDDGKPPLARLPWKGLRAVAEVMQYGNDKYGNYDNYRLGMEVSRNLSCAIRHISEYMEGEDLDQESQKSHLAHAAARLLFVLQNQADGTAEDDRSKV